MIAGFEIGNTSLTAVFSAIFFLTVPVIKKSKYGFDVHCPILPGCNSQGNTLEEALENIKDAIATYLEMVAEETKDFKVYEVEVAV